MAPAAKKKEQVPTQFNQDQINALTNADIGSLEGDDLLFKAQEIQNALKQENGRATGLGGLLQNTLQKTKRAVDSIEGTTDLLKEYIGNLFPQNRR